MEVAVQQVCECGGGEGYRQTRGYLGGWQVYRGEQEKHTRLFACFHRWKTVNNSDIALGTLEPGGRGCGQLGNLLIPDA